MKQTKEVRPTSKRREPCRQPTAFLYEEGRKVGYEQGKAQALKQVLEMLKKHNKLIEEDETLSSREKYQRHWALQHFEDELKAELEKL